MARDRRSSINDRRSGRRQDLRYAARIESLTDGTEIPCTLVDVSQTGARLLADQDPKPKAALNATLLALLVAFWLSGFVAGREAYRAVAAA